MTKALLAALLALCLSAPSAATIRALPARTSIVPAGLSVPRLSPTALLGAHALSFRAPSSFLKTPTSEFSAPRPDHSAPPAPVPFSAAQGFEVPLAADAAGAGRAAPETDRAAWEKAWSGAARRSSSDDAVAAVPAAISRPPSALPMSTRPARLTRFTALAAALPIPAFAAVSAPLSLGWISAVLPYLQAGGLIAGTYGAMRLSRWLIGVVGRKLGAQPETIGMARFVVSAGLWGAAAGYGLSLAGVSDNTLMTAFGGSGAAMALAIKDVLGNLVHAVHFLVSRPFTVGSQVVIDDVPGTVQELTLRYVIIRTEQNPSDAYYTYSELIAKPVTVRGAYQTKSARQSLRRPALPHGFLRALRDAAAPALWRPAFYSALGVAALSLLPAARGWFALKGAAGWFDAALPWASAGVILFLGRSIDRAVSGALTRLGQRYGWPATVTTLLKLGASALVWGTSGSFALNMVGVAWGTLAASLSISTIVFGVAVNDYVSGVFQAFLLLLLKPFRIGDRIAVGKHEGEVLDISFQHVVLKKDEQSHILLPYASVKGFRSGRDYGQKANKE